MGKIKFAKKTLRKMSYFTKLNQKLDEGWVMSNMNCDECKGSMLYHLDLKTAMCSKCDKIMDVVVETPKPDATQITPDSEMMTEKKAPVNNYDEGSKKIGEYLLQGWCMKETSCAVCLFPHMESRQNELVCVNCGPVTKPGSKKAEQ